MKATIRWASGLHKPREIKINNITDLVVWLEKEGTLILEPGDTVDREPGFDFHIKVYDDYIE